MNRQEQNERSTYRSVGKCVRKKDAMQLLLGKPVYVDDITPRDALVVKVIRSPHAHALIESVEKSAAMKVPGIVGIYTYEDVPGKRFTMAGQTYPEPSPYDRLLLDRRVRFVGDPVAIVAGETEAAVNRACKIVRVKYQVLEPVLDFHKAKDNPILVHPEENWVSMCPVGADNRRNLCASDVCSENDVEAVLADCDEVIEHTYHVKACQQTMMETFRTYTEIDRYGRLHVISSTQIVFHCRRIIANALDIPKSKVHVEKPRIGGGFGAKQTVVAEIYPAFVTWVTKRPAKMIYTREEWKARPFPLPAMKWRLPSDSVHPQTAPSVRWMSIPFPTQERSANTALPRSACPDIRVSHSIPAIWKPFVSLMMLSTPMCRQRARTEATARRRDSSRWRVP